MGGRAGGGKRVAVHLAAIRRMVIGKMVISPICISLHDDDDDDEFNHKTSHNTRRLHRKRRWTRAAPIYAFTRQEFIPFFGGKSNRLGEAFQWLCQLIGHREPVPTLTGILF